MVVAGEGEESWTLVEVVVALGGVVVAGENWTLAAVVEVVVVLGGVVVEGENWTLAAVIEVVVALGGEKMRSWVVVVVLGEEEALTAALEEEGT